MAFGSLEGGMQRSSEEAKPSLLERIDGLLTKAEQEGDEEFVDTLQRLGQMVMMRSSSGHAGVEKDDATQLAKLLAEVNSKLGNEEKLIDDNS